MIEVNLEGIVESLRSERERLRELVREFKAEIDGVKQTLFRIEKVVSGLERDPRKRVVNADANISSTEIVGRVELIPIIEEELKRKGVVEAELLKRYVEGEVNRRGKSWIGLELSMRGALSDERFVDTPGGFRLKGAEEIDEEGKEEAIVR